LALTVDPIEDALVAALSAGGKGHGDNRQPPFRSLMAIPGGIEMAVDFLSGRHDSSADPWRRAAAAFCG
jgi:hypothetical protein